MVFVEAITDGTIDVMEGNGFHIDKTDLKFASVVMVVSPVIVIIGPRLDF